MKFDIHDYVETSYGPAGWVIAYSDQPTYVIELMDGSRTSVVESTIKLSRKPKPLPNVPGFYVGDYDRSPSGKIVIQLLNSPPGTWVDNSDSNYLEEQWVRRLGNLTRLVPVSEGETHD
jgi:hypothetical protein